MKNKGLTENEVRERILEGKVNKEKSLNKSVRSIIINNACTLFNLVNLIFAILLLSVGSYKNMLFMGVVFSNLFIGIFQEIRAKRAVDKLSLLNAIHARVLRDDEWRSLSVDQVVIDDILMFKNGDQICADCAVLSGTVAVNEAFLTGESEPVTKSVGESLLKGSFVVLGECEAKATAVGESAYIATISKGAKKFVLAKSEIMDTLRTLIRIVAIAIFPIGIMLFIRQNSLVVHTNNAIVGIVAALIGMIPEGLMLLTSTVLAVSVIRLSKKSVLTRELNCIETLARVDTLCIDKTGTLTTGNLDVENTVLLDDSYEFSLESVLSAFVNASFDENPTIGAIRGRYGSCDTMKCIRFEPFSSSRKWSAATFDIGTFVFGAPDIIAKDETELLKRISDLSKKYRVLLLSYSPSAIEGSEFPKDLKPYALITLSDKIRESARPTIEYFMKQGVRIIVISGDSRATVQSVAEKVGVPDAHMSIDVSSLSDDELSSAANSFIIFARVRPEQKALILKSLKKSGRTVAMVGDGVNDVLALREADCSVGMASGSDAVKSIAQFCLIKSDFSAMPSVVSEGRRAINNIERSASLFLVKTIYSALIAVVFTLFPLQYPFIPIQLSLISTLTIGIPSFILALEPNTERVRGHFFRNVLKNALPSGITIFFAILCAVVISGAFKLNVAEIKSIAFFVTAFSSFMTLISISVPKFFSIFQFKKGSSEIFKSYLWRLTMLYLLISAFLINVFAFPGFFALAEINEIGCLVMLGIFAASTVLFAFLKAIVRKFM
ncbi:MAG: HAD-IC family P-type ATPase [Clostridia bacterium]